MISAVWMRVINAFSINTLQHCRWIIDGRERPYMYTCYEFLIYAALLRSIIEDAAGVVLLVWFFCLPFGASRLAF